MKVSVKSAFPKNGYYVVVENEYSKKEFYSENLQLDIPIAIKEL